MRNKLIGVLSFLLWAILLHSQVLPDQLWLLGKNENSGQPGYGNAVLRFDQASLDISQQDLHMNFESTVASMVDSSGKLLFYTNGCYVANAVGDTMENGEGLNPGEMNDWTCGTTGYVAPFGAMALASPAGDAQYILLHIGINYSEGKKLSYGPFYYSIIDMAANGGLGKVVSKNNILVDNHDLAPFSVVRHGNGRDWWVVVPEYGTDAYYKFIVSNTGVHPVAVQHIGAAITCRYIGTGAFSKQGDRYARQHHCGIFINDFDRCTGMFSNARHIPFPPNAFGGGGVAFTPDGKKVLTTTQMAVMAVNLAVEPPTLDTIVDFLSVLGTSLGLMQYGGDGKLYYSTMGRGAFYHVCTNPADTAGNLGFQFRGQPLPVQNIRTLPNLPNFRLYDFSDSPCDTLGISVANRDIEAPETVFTISPNPAATQIHIQFSGIDPVSINIYDMTGNRRVKQACSESQTEFFLDVSGLNPGIYCVCLQDQFGRVASKLIVMASQH